MKSRVRRYLPVARVAHHRTLAVVDLRFFAGLRADHDARFDRPRSAQLHHVSHHACVLPREAVVGDQVLPDRHRVAAALQSRLDDLPVRLARARRRAAAWSWRRFRRREPVITSMAGFESAIPQSPAPSR